MQYMYWQAIIVISCGVPKTMLFFTLDKLAFKFMSWETTIRSLNYRNVSATKESHNWFLISKIISLSWQQFLGLLSISD